MKAALALVVAFPLLFASTGLAGQAPPPPPGPGDAALAEYFRRQTASLARDSLADVRTPDDWNRLRPQYRQQLAEMLGLWPMPPRTDLQPTITGQIEHPQFTVEKLHFQSRPGLYVTANLYIPKGIRAPYPAVLYVCGHANFKKDGVSYGAKVQYQHHGAWFARNGYVCLVLDTLQLGEIEGIHHGTYREKMWWWHSRGYTPAGVEAWNGIRAIDYLQSRPEVDPARIGMTGRSGGGAYSWWVSALDERVAASVPVAGITDMRNHVVDGCIEGHCDCMYMVNTYRWDFAPLAALVSPRPLLISNTDKDSIFPLDGVVRLHEQVRRIYQLQKAADNLGLLITEGPHKDTQDLQVPAFRWFNRFLKNDSAPVEMVATRLFAPEDLRVFTELPADQINTRIHEVFVPMASPPAVPSSRQQWTSQRDAWLGALKAQSFAAWPAENPPLDLQQTALTRDLGRRMYEFTSQDGVRLGLSVVARRGTGAVERVILRLADEEEQENASEPVPNAAVVYFAPRGIGPTAWIADERKQTQIRRRFALLGQTVDGMRVWDVRRAIQAVRSIERLEGLPLTIEARGRMAGIALYASLFEPAVASLDLHDLPRSHREGPDFLNVLKILDLPAAAAMAAERARITLHQKDAAGWEFPSAVAASLGWDAGQFRVVAAPPAE